MGYGPLCQPCWAIGRRSADAASTCAARDRLPWDVVEVVHALRTFSAWAPLPGRSDCRDCPPPDAAMSAGARRSRADPCCPSNRASADLRSIGPDLATEAAVQPPFRRAWRAFADSQQPLGPRPAFGMPEEPVAWPAAVRREHEGPAMRIPGGQVRTTRSGDSGVELAELSVSDLSSVAIGQREQRLGIRGVESVVVVNTDQSVRAARQRRIEWRRSVDHPHGSLVPWIRAPRLVLGECPLVLLGSAHPPQPLPGATPRSRTNEARGVSVHGPPQHERAANRPLLPGARRQHEMHLWPPRDLQTCGSAARSACAQQRGPPARRGRGQLRTVGPLRTKFELPSHQGCTQVRQSSRTDKSGQLLVDADVSTIIRS